MVAGVFAAIAGMLHLLYNLNATSNLLAVDTTINSLQIIFDEGTDVGPGFAVLDNISYNGLVAGGPATDH